MNSFAHNLPRPLLPSTCQSVRMDFLALSPGVHSVETLTLTDIQTGYTMNLRCVATVYSRSTMLNQNSRGSSVLDVVVHEHELDLSDSD